MKFYRVKVTQNAASVASAFNESFKPEIIPESADPDPLDWITEPSEEVFVGDKVWQLWLPPFVCFVLTGCDISADRWVAANTGTAIG